MFVMNSEVGCLKKFRYLSWIHMFDDVSAYTLRKPEDFFFLILAIKKNMDIFQIVLEVSSTIMSMHTFFLAVSQIHKKIECNKPACKIQNFLDGLNEFLFTDWPYSEICGVFTNYCIKNAAVFDVVYELTLQKNSDKLEKLTSLLAQIDELKK